MSVNDYTIQDWESLSKLYVRNFSASINKVRWIFRAENRDRSEKGNITKCDISDLKTSLDKVFDSFQVDKSNRRKLEESLLREFQRKAHHYLPYVPKKNNTIEWLTFIQHYGGPTRLLDWTYSFYVAVFFAVARLNCSRQYGEVWIADSKVFKDRATQFCTTKKLKELLRKRKTDDREMDNLHNAIIENLFKKAKPIPLALLLNAFRLNERLVIQQGTFLLQGDVEKSFGENIKEMKIQNKYHLSRIVIDVTKSQRNNILKELNAININSATLFPGLQGFSESLATQLSDPGKFGVL